jgi:hypothetical protein
MARHRAYKVEFERQAVEEHPGAAVRLLTDLVRKAGR